MQNDFINEMISRGFLYQCSNLDGLIMKMNAGKITAYLGSDPTADSLHVGHLVPVMMMRWLQKFGHKPLMLVGGATGRIGDPSGRDSGRPMMDEQVLARNILGLKKSYSKFIPNIELVDNFDWHREYSHMGFLSEFGTDFTVPRMLSMESVKRRLETGMTFLEFNYMTFQAVDFYNLYKNHNCILQTCGADQWGNCIMGIELIRKKLGAEAFVLSTALITDSNGNKIGKSAGNAIWVNEEKTSPYEYYQYFRNVSDDIVEKFLKIFTEIPLNEIAEIINGDINIAKEKLAFAATEIAHGTHNATNAMKDARALFSGNISPENAPIFKLNKNDIINIVDILTETNLAPSKAEARRLIAQNGVKIDGAIATGVEEFSGNFDVLIQKGKKVFLRVKNN